MIYNDNLEEIFKVLDLTNENKYEKTCASFHLADHLYLLEDLPSNLKNKKPTVQSIYLISDKKIKYGYSQSVPIEEESIKEEKKEESIQEEKKEESIQEENTKEEDKKI